MSCNFAYTPTATGELSGPSMIAQTELVINELCALADGANVAAENAASTATTALSTVQTALSEAQSAQTTAATALTTAQSAAGAATSAGTLAAQANTAAQDAQTAAQNAQTNAATALTSAQSAVAEANTALSTAQSAFSVAGNAMPKTGGTFTGGVFDAGVVMSAAVVDLSLGNTFSKTIADETTFLISGVPTSGAAACFSLILTNGGAYTVTWPSSVKWADSTPPDLTASGVDVLTFLTVNGGTTWYGVASVLGAA